MLVVLHQTFTIMKPESGYSRPSKAGSVSRELMEEIRSFFDATDPGSFKTTLFNILLAYGGRYYYNSGEPIEVVETLDRLGQLLAVVKSQAGNPEASLAHFFEDDRYLNIEGTLRSIRFFALCRQSGMEDGAAIDTLKFYHDVTILIDACDSILKASAGG